MGLSHSGHLTPVTHPQAIKKSFQRSGLHHHLDGMAQRQLLYLLAPDPGFQHYGQSVSHALSTALPPRATSLFSLTTHQPRILSP